MHDNYFDATLQPAPCLATGLCLYPKGRKMSMELSNLFPGSIAENTGQFERIR